MTLRAGALGRCLALLLALAAPTPARAQYLTRPALDWRTLHTAHFVFHFPVEMEQWTRDVAGRAESIHEAVAGFVGFAPEQIVTVLVEDPSNVSNGFALPFLDAPTLFLWPTPPDPSSVLARNRDWGEVLTVHEFTHLAHLARPSRNARQQRLWNLLPVDLGPVARRAPRWLFEGYATFVEGRLTGSGRPAGAARAAILREWALEGQLPTYGQLDGNARFLGGSMAYLVGSAYLDWLATRAGDESLDHLWRRMSARTDRSFVSAFVGVYGAPPDELYGRFTAELTGSALAVEDSVRARGLAEGELFQRLSLATGAPARSPNGDLLAVVLRRRDAPSRLVVWSTRPDTGARGAARRRDSVLALDPEDVAAVPGRPGPRRARYTLEARGGRSHEQPRFLADGERILVVRSVPQGDGTERPDLFVWRFATGELRRATYDAGIREADPTPDGAHAIGVRCRGGICDVVRVSLTSGDVDVLLTGSPARTYFHPRVAPDGRSVLLSVHEADRWRLVVAPLDGGEPRAVDPDDGASRYGGEYLPDGRAVVATSEVGGIMHLERIALDDGSAVRLTRGSGAAISPTTSRADDVVYFLALHARGYDVRRISADSVAAGDAPRFTAALYPAVPPPRTAPADTFARQTLPASEPYGLGPREYLALPAIVAGPEGALAIAAFSSSDPVGRFAWLVQGALGSRGAWRGAALTAELRTFEPRVRGDVFVVGQQPGEQPARRVTLGTVGHSLDATLAGGALSAAIDRDRGVWAYRGEAGVSLASLHGQDEQSPTTRSTGWAGTSGGLSWQRGQTAVVPRLGLRLSSGRTFGTAWSRGRIDGSVDLRALGFGAQLSGALGIASSHAPAYERFAVGGQAPPLTPARLLDQRWSVPALPVATTGGSHLAAYRADVPLSLATAFYSASGAGDVWRAPNRVVGVERAFVFPSISFLGLPAVRILGGAARSLDAPYARRTRAYLSVSYDP